MIITINLHAACNIDDCNRVHNLCNTSSPQRQPSKEPVALGNEQPINCTFIQIPNQAGLTVACHKGEYQLTFNDKSNTITDCNRDLGINCNLGKQKIIRYSMLIIDK